MNDSRAVSAVIAVIAIVALFGSTGSIQAEECAVAPSVGVSVSQDSNGIVTAIVSYSFPETTAASQRGLTLWVGRDGAAVNFIAGTRPASIAGVWTVSHDVSCEPSGNYTYKAIAGSCDRHVRESSTSLSYRTDPTVSVSYEGPDDQGHGKVVVDYNFPNTSDPSQRTLLHQIHDSGGFGWGPSLNPADQTGTWTFPYDMTCRTGSFTHKVIAVHCNGTQKDASDVVNVSTKPTVSASVGGLQENGDVDVRLHYGFPNTDHPSQRSVILRIEESGGGFGTFGSIQPEAQYGEWPVTYNVACDLRNLSVWPIATSCTREEAETRQPLPKPERPTVSVSLSKVKGEPGMIDATIQYSMGKGSNNWSLRLDLVSWKDADGVEYRGGILMWPEATPARNGTKVFRFPAPRGAQQLMVRATASTCIGTDTAQAGIECEPCEGSTADPVFLSSGNVRVTDSDPLPPIARQLLVRTYNSDEQVVALFGRGWTTVFDRRMIRNRVDDEEVSLSFVTATNTVATFRAVGGAFQQIWPHARHAADVLAYDAATATYGLREAGSSEMAVFRTSDGRLVALRDLTTGREASVTYNAQGLPIALADSWSGTSWNLTIQNRRVTSIAVSGRPDIVWTYNYDAGGNLMNVLAPGGGTWRTYEYAANRMTASRDALGNLIESHTYDADGYGISSTGPTDEIARIDYDLAGSVAGERVTRVTYKTGAVAEYALRVSGGAYRPVRIRGACASCGAREAAYVRDARGRIVRHQHADGYVTERTYSGDYLESEERYLRPSGCDPQADTQHCRLDPDALAAVTLVPTAATVRTSFEHNDPLWPDRLTGIETPSVYSSGRTRREDLAYHARTGALVGTTVHGWMGEEPIQRDRTTASTFYGDGGAVAPAFVPGGVFQSAWLTLPQPNGLRKSTDEARTDVQDVSLFVYYPIDPSVPALLRGQLAASRNALGHITRYETYDIFGNATRVVDPNGLAAETSYDTLGRLVMTSVDGHDTMRTYSGAGPLQTEQRPAGGVTTYTYDARRRVHTISRGPTAADLRERIEYAYDPLTGKTSSERCLAFENGAWVEKRSRSLAYDALAQLRSIMHADGASVGYQYDVDGRLESVRDENHSTSNTTYDYDPAGRLAVVTQTLAGALGGVITTRYGYDLHGNLTAVIDPNGNTTTYAYDDFGQMLRQTSPVTGVTTYLYDDAGNLRSTTNANGVTTTRQYDALGRVTASVSASQQGAEEVRWSYDATLYGIGHLATMTDPTGSTQYSYERRGLLTSEAKTIAGATYTTQFTYDANGNRSGIRYPSGRVVTYAFDYADRPISASTGGFPLVTSASYLPFGPLTEVAFGNGTTKRMTFDARYQPLTNTLTGGEDAIASYSYTHDPAGNITSIRDDLDPSFDRLFGYDDLNRLTSANTGEGLWGLGSYSYDRMGNMRSMTLGSRTAAFSYQGSTPKITTAVENGSSRAVTYDPAGNEIAVGSSTYAYTPRNHLARQDDTTYVSDGRGIRTITIRPASLLALNLPSAAQGGSTVAGEVVLSSPAPAGGAVVTLTTSSSNVASVPSSITVPAGAASGAFTIATKIVTGEQHVIVTASYNGSVRTATLTVVGSRFDTFAVTPRVIVGGGTAHGTVILATPAPEEGTTIHLESSGASVRVPEGVFVRGGDREAEFSVTTMPVRVNTAARIVASADGESREADVTILPPSAAALTFDPPVLQGGSATTGSVTLNGRAPEGGIAVGLTSADEALSLPEAVTVAAGEERAIFTASAAPVEVMRSVTVTASLDGSRATANVTIQPPHLTDLAVTPGRVIGGDSVTAHVTISAPAAPEGARVDLSTSDPAIVAAPAQMEVPSGTTSGATTLTTGAVAAPTPVVVSASRSGVIRSTTVTVEPPAVTISSLAIQPSSVVGTNEARGTVTLTGPAPAGGIEVELAASGPAATVPPVLLIPAGATQGDFAIATSLVATPTTVNINAAHASTQKTASLGVTPPAGNYIVSNIATPTFIVGGTTATVKITLAMPSAENGGSEITIATSAPAVVGSPGQVTVKKNSIDETFTIATAPVTEPLAVTIAATYGGVVQRTKVIVAPQNAVTLASFSIDPARVIGGGPATGTLTLTGPAPFGGAAVTIAAKRRNMVTVPATVHVPEGATSTVFSIGTERVHGNKERSVEIVARYNGVDATATLIVTPGTNAAAPSQPVARCASLALQPCLTLADLPSGTSSTTVYERSYSFYSPELTLLAETHTSSSTATSIAYEYIWFGSMPLAQVDVSTGETGYYFTDHLGTPLLQTTLAHQVAWRVEYEPYGRVAGVRRGEVKHQPLRLPGQIADVHDELNYNTLRWYRAEWARYSQADPLALVGGTNLFIYARSNPLRYSDPLGLRSKGFDPFDIPDIPSMPGPFPNTACCSRRAIREAIASVDRHIKGMMGGEVPTGTVVAATIMAYSCYKGVCTPMAADPSLFNFDHSYNPDKCVNYCVNFHEWVHFSDTRTWKDAWTDVEKEIFHEMPAYVGEKACLLEMREGASKP